MCYNIHMLRERACCRKCKKYWDVECFYLYYDEQTERDVIVGPCKACRRDSYYKRQYGKSLVEIEDLLISQKFRCVICLTPIRCIEKGFVDHDHKTGTVRGVLCSACNAGLGHFRDDIPALYRAIEYLVSALPEETALLNSTTP